VRSNATKSRATTLSTPIKSPPRRSLALAAVALACMLASSVEAVQRSAPADGPGRVISGAGGSDQGGDDGAAAGQRTVHRSKISVRHAKQRRQVPDHVPDEVLTLLVSGVSEDAIAALGRRLRLGRVASLTADNITTFRWKILDRRSVSAVVRSLQAEPIVLAAQPNYTYQLGQAAGAARPPSHGRSGRTRLSLNGSKPLISPEASGVDRVISSGADAPAPEFLGGIRTLREFWPLLFGGP
jgi:hypothetical protein